MKHSLGNAPGAPLWHQVTRDDQASASLWLGSQRRRLCVHCSLMWLTRRPTLAVLLCGAFVHAALLTVVLARTGRIDSSAFDSIDCREFYRIAQKAAEYGTFSQSDQPPFVADTWRTPGYPLFLAAFMSLLGHSPTVLVIVQQFLSILSLLLLFRLARHWMSERRAMVVAVLFLLEPYHLKYSLWLMSTTLFVTVLLLVWHTWEQTVRTRRWVWVVPLGGLCGVLVLVRPVSVLVPVAVFVGMTVDILRRSGEGTCPTTGGSGRAAWLGRVLLPIVFAAACFVVVGSWMLRNSRVAGNFALSDQGGVVLAYFKATEVILWREGRSQDRYLETTLDPERADHPHRVWEQLDAELRESLGRLPGEERATLRWQNLAQGMNTSVDSFLVSRALAAIGRSHLTRSPLSTAACCLVRCGSILTFPLCLAIKPPTGVDVSRAGALAKGVVYLLLCAAVVLRLARGKITFAGAFFPIACTLTLLLATTPQLDPRFRVPMIPVLLVLAFLPVRGEGSQTGDSPRHQSHAGCRDPQ